MNNNHRLAARSAANVPPRINTTNIAPSVFASNGQLLTPVESNPRYGRALAIVEDTVESHELREYGEEIYSFMKTLEITTSASSNYMESIQSEHPRSIGIDAKMRRTLVVWLIEVHKEYSFRAETLYLAVNILDRYCSQVPVMRVEYQLVGITALWIAAKYEENHGKVPNVKNLSFMCCDSYNEKAFTKQENDTLRVLEFDLGHITPETFAKRLITINPNYFADQETRAVARFIMELSLTSYEFIKVKPSIIAQSSLLLAHQIVKRHPGWSQDLEVAECRNMLMQCIHSAPNPIVHKYSDAEFCYASSIAQSSARNIHHHRYQSMPVPVNTATPSQLIASGQLTPPKESAGQGFWSHGDQHLMSRHQHNAYVVQHHHQHLHPQVLPPHQYTTNSSSGKSWSEKHTR